jgi:hypothetical protein
MILLIEGDWEAIALGDIMMRGEGSRGDLLLGALHAE